MLEVNYGLNDVSEVKGTIVGVSVTSETVNDVRMYRCMYIICL